jgi:hypothetical protein
MNSPFDTGKGIWLGKLPEPRPTHMFSDESEYLVHIERPHQGWARRANILATRKVAPNTLGKKIKTIESEYETQ